MFVKVNGIGLFGINTYPVQVESSVERTAMPRFDLVGLPDVAVREAKERVRAAMKNSDFFFPTARITMNLSPADKKKEGTGFDLPILVALLLFGAEKLISALLGVKIMAITSANSAARSSISFLPGDFRSKKTVSGTWPSTSCLFSS